MFFCPSSIKLNRIYIKDVFYLIFARKKLIIDNFKIIETLIKPATNKLC